MNKEILRSFVEIIQDDLNHKKSVTTNYNKIRNVLEKYSIHIGLKDNTKLQLLDLVDEKHANKLSRSFVNFIDEYNCSEKYKGEIKSRTLGIIRIINAESGIRDEIDLYPKFMEEMYLLLPRVGCSNIKIKDINKRKDYPLTDAGRKLLSVYLKIQKKKNVENVESFYSKYLSELYLEVRQTYSFKEAQGLVSRIQDEKSKAIKHSLIKEPKPKKKYIPEKLELELEEFIRLTEMGFHRLGDLQLETSRHGFKMKGLNSLTVKMYVEVIKNCISKLDLNKDENIGICDLLRLEEKSVDDKFNNKTRKILSNPYVDKIRYIEQTRESQFKRKDFDSHHFQIFIRAIVAKAKYLGIFKPIKQFRQSYRIILDDQTSQERKQLQRQIFDRNWLDSEIEKLTEQFRVIVREGSFRNEPEKRPKAESLKNINLCLFLVHLVTLRYLGFRQQLVRDCKIGKNIFFTSQGIIGLQFSKHRIKSKKPFEIELDKKCHGTSHGLMMEVLQTYYKRIYQYIKSNSAHDLEDQFFVRVNNFKFYKHKKDSHQEINRLFKNWGHTFFEFEGRNKDYKNSVNPHFLRGVYSDWLYYDLKASISTTARFITDTEQMVEKRYVDKNGVFDLSGALTDINQTLKEREEYRKNLDSDEHQERLNQKHREELAARDAEINVLKKQLTEQNPKLDQILEALTNNKFSIKENNQDDSEQSI